MVLSLILILACGPAAADSADPGRSASYSPRDAFGFADPRGASKEAWQLFSELNRPARPGECPCPDDDSSCHEQYLAWECWADSKLVFRESCSDVEWDDRRAEKSLEAHTRQSVLFLRELARRGRGEEKSRYEELLESQRVEIRMNREAFDWLMLDDQWQLDQQLKLYDLFSNPDVQLDPFADPGALNAPDIAFRFDSRFVKAAWVPIDGKDEAEQATYYSRVVDGRRMGLIALHLSAKILPQWFWATWEHESNPARAAVDTREPLQGTATLAKIFAAAGLDDVWKHYRLNGVQTSFVDGQGNPVVLASSIFEAGHLDSSCMSCHARISVQRTATGGVGRLSLFSPNPLGPPDPTWFSGGAGSRPYLQLDFVGVLMRAKAKPSCK